MFHPQYVTISKNTGGNMFVSTGRQNNIMTENGFIWKPLCNRQNDRSPRILHSSKCFNSHNPTKDATSTKRPRRWDLRATSSYGRFPRLFKHTRLFSVTAVACAIVAVRRDTQRCMALSIGNHIARSGETLAVPALDSWVASSSFLFHAPGRHNFS